MDLRDGRYITPSTPATQVFFDTATPTTGGVIFDPDTPALADTLYVSSLNGSTWIYQDGSYITYTAPVVNNTEWYIKGTSIDAGGNKTTAILRSGPVYAGNLTGINTGDQTFLNARVQTVTSSATVTPTSANDLVKITAQAVGLTLANPTGTFTEGQALIIRVTDNGTARSIAYGTKYRGTTLPTTTVVGSTSYIPLIYNATDNKFDNLSASGITSTIPVAIQLAASDETTALTSGTSKVTFRMPHAMTLTSVRASLNVAGTTSGITTIDINEGGVSILSTKLTIDLTEKTSTTAATPSVISDASLADDAEITIDIDAISGGATEKGLKITLIGTRTV